jgi:type IV pilus assembly protein PilW
VNAHLSQRGLSLVELMVGIAIGLVIVAAALAALTHHLRENRSLLVEARLMQDLRTASDLIARDLRRAGHWVDADAGAWRTASPNPHAEFSPSDAAVSFSYSRSGQANEQLAYRLRQGVIEMKLGDANWQAMTDANTLRVSSFSVTPQVQEIVLVDFCSRPCPAGSETCPPRQAVRSLAVQVEANAPHDPLLNRSVQATVRLRNDALIGACPA